MRADKRAQAARRVEELEALIQADPDDRDLWFLLGKALLDAEQPVQAIERLAEAARRNPGLAAIRRLWGEALRAAGRPAEARQVWTDGIALAERTGDLQAGKEMKALLRKIEP